jgi:hypothetical protein
MNAALDYHCETSPAAVVPCDGELVYDEDCCPIQCMQEGCDCSITKTLEFDTASDFKLTISKDPVGSQDPLDGLAGTNGDVEANKKTKYTIQKADKSAFCIQEIKLKAKCANKVTAKAFLTNGEKQTVKASITDPTSWELATITFQGQEVDKVIVGLIPSSGCPTAMFKNLKMDYCD